MFGNWSLLPATTGPDGTSLVSQIYKYKGPLPFPGYGPDSPPSDPHFTIPTEEQSFYKYFAKVRRATDVTRRHLDVLNVSVAYNVPVQDMVSGAEWLPTDSDETWAERQRELLIENHVANEVMARVRRDVKLGHMYKFFQSLEMVLPYYGTAAECAAYAAEKEAELVQQHRPQDAISNSSSSGAGAGSDKMDIDSHDSPSNEHGKRPASTEIQHGFAKKDRASPEFDIPEKKEEKKFSMPERFRDDLVKNFIEPICWGHGVRVYPPRPAPKFHLQCSKFSIHLNYHIHLTPMDPTEARSGLVDGPVLGIQIRHEHAFRAFSDPAAALKKRRKKLMAATLAAKVPPTAEEEAAREKRIEKEKARSERHAKRGQVRKSEPQEDKEETPIVGEMKEEVEDLLGNEGILVTAPDGTPQDVVGVTREIVALLSIAQLRAKEGLTERKIRFRAVGKQDGFWDDIFTVTCLHHHISVSHLRVSEPYLRFLRTGKLPRESHPFIKEGGWEKLQLQKTRYWSLLDPKERVEGARALVTVLRWITRNEGKRVG